MKRKGFTLVELLAVIAILAILVIIALPNVMGMFNTAKENSFKTEVKEIFKVAQNQWMQDSMYSTNIKSYSRCDNGCNNSLDLSGRSDLKYYIEVDKSGGITKYCATDGTFQYYYSGESLKVENINSVEKLSDSNVTKLEINNGSCKKGSVITILTSGVTKDNIDLCDSIQIGEEKFVISKIEGNTITATSYYNLDLTDEPHQKIGAQNVPFSRTRYWSASDRNIDMYYKIDGVYANYIQNHIDNYKITLNKLGLSNVETKIASGIGNTAWCKNPGQNGRYWTSTPNLPDYNQGVVIVISSTGSTLYYPYTYNDAGVRALIIFDRDEL